MRLPEMLVAAALFVHTVLATAPLSLPSTAIHRSILTSNTAKCPCTVDVHRSRFSRSETSDNAFDLLAVHKDEWDLISSLAHIDASTIKFVARYSYLNNSLSTVLDSDAFFYHFRRYKIEEIGEFVVVIRSSRKVGFDPSDYIVRIRPVHHQSKACPIKLSPDPPKTRRYEVNKTSEWAHGPIIPEPRIVGGELASSNLAPYMVVVYNPEQRFCSGALLSARWAVTAAHCKVNTSFTVGLLTTQAYRNGQKFAISRVIQHPKYGSTGPPRQNDICLLELAEPAPEGSKFMMVNSDIAKPKEGEFARVAGYGTISYMNILMDKTPRSLRQVDLPIATQSQCFKAYERWEVISKKKQICAGYFDDGGCDACSGDSGGPLMQYTFDGKPILIGLTSYGLGCALANFPGVYARVSAFIPWMRTTPAVFAVTKNTDMDTGTKSTTPLATPSPSTRVSRQPNPSPTTMPSRTATLSPIAEASHGSIPTLKGTPSRKPTPCRTPTPSPSVILAPSQRPPSQTPSPSPRAKPSRKATPRPTVTSSQTVTPSPKPKPPSPIARPSPEPSPSSVGKPSRSAQSQKAKPVPAAKPSKTFTPSRHPNILPTLSPSQSPQQSRQATASAVITPSPRMTPPRKNQLSGDNPEPSSSGGRRQPCKPGWKLKGKQCVVCYKHAISPGGFVKSCTRCPKGFTRDVEDGSKCACGKGRGLDAGECKLCPPGWFAMTKDQKCKRCVEGFFARRYGSSRCKPCPVGEVPTKDQKKCRTCRGTSECAKATATDEGPGFATREVRLG